MFKFKYLRKDSVGLMKQVIYFFANLCGEDSQPTPVQTLGKQQITQTAELINLGILEETLDFTKKLLDP